MSALEQLDQFCLQANQEIFRYYGSRGSCIFSTGVICEVLAHFGFQAEPIRVETGLFHDDPKSHGCVLGSSGDGTRRPAAGKDMWAGHLASIANERYLIDTTLDQANENNPHLHAKPIVIDLRATKWFDQDLRGGQCTGLLRLWDDVQVRYSPAWRQVGWKSAGDFLPSRRREIVPLLLKITAPIFL